ncbi:MAG: response regulator [Candidatus Omnitrophica bacterium]|nr:response regulator [Candidatus Omnitrophota bacterium]
MSIKKQILIVDDEEDIVQSIIRRMISTYSDRYEPHVATDGFEAMDILMKKDIDLVILDIRMPNMDGTEVAKRVLRDRKLRFTPIVISSGFVNESQKEEFRKMGIHHFLDKPYHMNDLFEVISQLLTS